MRNCHSHLGLAQCGSCDSPARSSARQPSAHRCPTQRCGRPSGYSHATAQQQLAAAAAQRTAISRTIAFTQLRLASGHTTTFADLRLASDAIAFVWSWLASDATDATAFSRFRLASSLSLATCGFALAFRPAARRVRVHGSASGLGGVADRSTRASRGHTACTHLP